MDDFGAEKARVMRDGRPSTGDDLLGMEADFAEYLARLDEIDGANLEVRRTARSDCLIEASCSARSGTSLQSAGAAAQTVWTMFLRYAEHEAHLLLAGDDRAVLDCVTQIEPGGLYVTARVTIETGPVVASSRPR